MRQNLSEWGSFYWVVPIVVISLSIVIWLERKPWKRPVLWSMLLVWVAGVSYLMFLYRLPPKLGKINLDFLHMYREAAGYKGDIATNQSLRQILFNVLLYIPLGAVLCSLTGTVWLLILIGIGLSVLTEFLQYWTGLGITDVDDVISNTLGLIAGVFFIWSRKTCI